MPEKRGRSEMKMFFLIFLQKIKKNIFISLRRGFKNLLREMILIFGGDTQTFVTSPQLSVDS
jgi:hypothetical protein